ncbi:MAG: hypothetical protein GY791_08520 [Alphaproteobacteria bacterium]|nr:hypothetical protein [Alphaproteobacteria bacterium]
MGRNAVNRKRDDEDETRPRGAAASKDRAERQAAALRANLRRRKAQTKARAERRHSDEHDSD